MRCEFVYGGRWHVDEIDSIVNEYEDDHERGRPDALAAGRAGGAGLSFAGTGQEPEEELRRFARDAVQWLDRKLDELEIEAIHLFAPPKFLGIVRRQYSQKLKACASDHQGDLSWLPPGDLAEHPAIQPLLGSGAPTG